MVSAATSMEWIEAKLKMLGVSSNPDYKICFYLDADAMISVHTPKYGVVEVNVGKLFVVSGWKNRQSPNSAIFMS